MTTLRTTADHLEYIFVPAPTIFLTPFAEAYWLLSRAYRAGWRFRVPVSPGQGAAGLEVKKPRGSGEWHRTDGERCDCIGRRLIGQCSHCEIVTGVGGVDVALAVCRQFDFTGAREEIATI